jgi:hypothetical protein
MSMSDRHWIEGVEMVETHTFEVGQELAIYARHCNVPTIRKVVSVSKTGRATLDSGTVINPDLRIRGSNKWGPFEAHIVTPRIREMVERADLVDQMRTKTDWGKLSLLTLRTVAFVLEHSK